MTNRKKEVKISDDKLSNNKNNNNSKIYVSYSLRVIILFIISFIFLILTILFSLKSIDYYAPEIVNYQEKSNLDYKVYLKENEFYEEDYLGKDMLYVASLIDNIVVDFNYLFDIDENISINFNYDIVAKLLINNKSDNKTYFEKEYVLLDKKQDKIVDKSNYKLYEQVKIDYNYYNLIASNFRKSYGIEAESNLFIYLRIKKNTFEETIKLNDESLMLLIIPLSEKAVNIQLDYKEIDNASYLISDKNIILDNVVYIIIAFICLIISMVFAVKFVRLISLLGNKKSNYDKYISKIMNEYDRLIVENLTGPKFEGNNVIKINKFEELLDVRDNLKLPIMYYNVVNHQKCYFYIKHNFDIYLLTVKAVDFENIDNHTK